MFLTEQRGHVVIYAQTSEERDLLVRAWDRITTALTPSLCAQATPATLRAIRNTVRNVLDAMRREERL